MSDRKKHWAVGQAVDGIAVEIIGPDKRKVYSVSREHAYAVASELNRLEQRVAELEDMVCAYTGQADCI